MKVSTCMLSSSPDPGALLWQWYRCYEWTCAYVCDLIEYDTSPSYLPEVEARSSLLSVCVCSPYVRYSIELKLPFFMSLSEVVIGSCLMPPFIHEPAGLLYIAGFQVPTLELYLPDLLGRPVHIAACPTAAIDGSQLPCACKTWSDLRGAGMPDRQAAPLPYTIGQGTTYRRAKVLA